MHPTDLSSFTLGNILVIEIATKYGLGANKSFNNWVKENILYDVMNQS